MKAENRLFEQLRPDAKINWWRDKKTYCHDLSVANKIKKVSVDKISQTLGLNLNSDEKYASYLLSEVLGWREAKKRKSIEVRHNQKEIKKGLLKMIIRKNPDSTKVELLEIFNKEENLSKRQFFRYLKEIETEKKRPQENVVINQLGKDFNLFIETKLMLKEINFNEIPNFRKGNFKSMTSLFNKTDANPNKIIKLLENHNTFICLSILSSTNGTLFYLDTFSGTLEEKVNKLQNNIDQEINDLDFNFDLSHEDFYRRASFDIKYINKMQDDVNVGKFLLMYKDKLIKKGVIEND
jgi:hypothetical protein